MPYGIPKAKGGDSVANINKLEACIAAINGNNPQTGAPYTQAEKIALCKTSLFCVEEFATQFAEDTSISAEKAKDIIDLLDTRWFPPENLNQVIWEIKEYIIDNQLKDIVDEMKPETLASIVDDRVAECMQRNLMQPCNECSYSEAKIWLFEELPSASFDDHKEYKPGDLVKLQIMRTGERDHSMYGKVKVDSKVLNDVVSNFKDNKRGIDLVVDENHEPDHKALAIFKDVYKKWKDALWATVELTRKGAELLTEGAYKYFSPEIQFKTVDSETSKPISNLLIGGALTNRPFFKGMQPVMAASEDVANQQQDTHRYSFIFTSVGMNKFMDMLNKLAKQPKINAEEKANLSQLFSELSADDKTVRLTAKFEDTVAKFSEDDATDADAATVEKTEEEKQAEADAAKKAEDDAAAAKTAEDAKTDDAGADTVTVQASEYNAEKAELVTLRKANRVAQFSEKVGVYQFNEAAKTGFILPKDKAMVAEFCADLTDAQAAKFFEIIEAMKPVVQKFTDEAGHGSDGAATEADKGNMDKANAFAEGLIKGGMPTKQAYTQAFKEYGIVTTPDGGDEADQE